MYFISNIFLRIRGGSKSSCTNAIFFALVQELIDRPSYINEQLLEHDAYISCLQLKKVNVAHDAMHNNYLYNHTAYYHVLQQVIAFLVHSVTSVHFGKQCRVRKFCFSLFLFKAELGCIEFNLSQTLNPIPLMLNQNRRNSFKYCFAFI